MHQRLETRTFEPEPEPEAQNPESDNRQVNRIKPGGFAQLSGAIETGQIIHSVDGTLCRGISQTELGALIMGVEGTSVLLRLQRQGAGAPVVEVKGIRSRTKQ